MGPKLEGCSFANFESSSEARRNRFSRSERVIFVLFQVCYQKLVNSTRDRATIPELTALGAPLALKAVGIEKG